MPLKMAATHARAEHTRTAGGCKLPDRLLQRGHRGLLGGSGIRAIQHNHAVAMERCAG